jgi:rhomboid protease GluP
VSRERWQGRSPLEAYPVSLGLLLAILMLYGATDLGLMGERGGAILAWGANSPGAFAAGEPWRPLTACFLHIAWWHILLNAWALWALCPPLEAALGSAKFSAIYFSAGLMGSFVSMMTERSSVGASGAIFGIMATYLRSVRVEFRTFGAALRDPVAGQFVAWGMLNAAISFAPGTSFAGHLGGFVGGWMMSAALLPALKGMDRGRVGRHRSWPKTALAAAVLAAVGAAAARPAWRADFHVQRAAALGRAERPTEALEAVAKARAAPLGHTDSLTAHFGYEADIAGRKELALALYALALEEGNSEPEVMNNAALILDAKGDEAALLEHLRRWRGMGHLGADWEDDLAMLEARERRRAPR